MSDGKQNYIPWLIAGAAVWMLISSGKKVPPDEPKSPVTSVVKKTIPSIREAYRSAFLEAASRIETGKIRTQVEWTEFIKENAGGKFREAMDSVYRAIDELNIPAEFTGREAEIASINRKIAEAW